MSSWLAAFGARGGEGKGVGSPGTSPGAVWSGCGEPKSLLLGWPSVWSEQVCANGQVTLGKGDHEGRQHLQPQGPCGAFDVRGWSPLQGQSWWRCPGSSRACCCAGTCPCRAVSSAFVGSHWPLPGIKTVTDEGFAQTESEMASWRSSCCWELFHSPHWDTSVSE